ncbi:MAG: hypothetical protein V3T23_00280 [Nitrososphaerales archaeon]
MNLVEQRIEEGMSINRIIASVMASDGVHFIVKDTLREALTKDPVDAYHDIQLVADILKAAMKETLS